MIKYLQVILNHYKINMHITNNLAIFHVYCCLFLFILLHDNYKSMATVYWIIEGGIAQSVVL